MLLADAIEPLKGLVEQWPWMVVVVAVAKWFAVILDRVATRHISFVDALDRRDQDSLVHQATMSLAVTGIDAKLALNATKSDFKELASKTHCEARDLLQRRDIRAKGDSE